MHFDAELGAGFDERHRHRGGAGHAPAPLREVEAFQVRHLQHEVQHGRHRQPDGDALFVHQLPRPLRIERPHDDGGDAAVDGEGDGRQGADVEHRQRREEAVAVVEVGGGGNGDAAPDAGVVGVDDALRQARGAGGVHDVEHVVVVRAERRFGRGGGVSESRVVVGEVGRLAVGHLQPLGDVGLLAAPVQVGHRVHELVVEDQPRGAAVLQDELQLVGDQPPIQRHHDGADLGEREIRLHELRAVHQEQRHALALRHAGAQEGVRNAVAALVQRREGEPPAVVADVRLALRRQERPLRQPPADVVLHASSPFAAALRPASSTPRMWLAGIVGGRRPRGEHMDERRVCDRSWSKRLFAGPILRSEPQFGDAPCVATPAMKPIDLIETARVLAESGPGRPTRASLRRAVSTAYYALFHCLAATAADLFIGQQRTPAWHRTYRALEHGRARSACREAQTTPRLPGGRSATSPRRFVALQKARHQADYALDADDYRQSPMFWCTLAAAELAIGQFEKADIEARSAASPLIALFRQRQW